MDAAVNRDLLTGHYAMHPSCFGRVLREQWLLSFTTVWRVVKPTATYTHGREPVMKADAWDNILVNQFQRAQLFDDRQNQEIIKLHGVQSRTQPLLYLWQQAHAHKQSACALKTSIL